MQEYGDSLLERDFKLFEESILLFFDVIGERSIGGAHLQFADIAAVVDADHVAIVNPAKHVDVQFVLDVADVPKDDALLDIHAATADIEIDLPALIDDL
jgi:hypothetical protein